VKEEILKETIEGNFPELSQVFSIKGTFDKQNG
jgi:hypothetical protein